MSRGIFKACSCEWDCISDGGERGSRRSCPSAWVLADPRGSGQSSRGRQFLRHHLLPLGPVASHGLAVKGFKSRLSRHSRACLFPRLPRQVLAHLLSSAVPSRSLAIAIGLPRSRRSLNSTPRRLFPCSQSRSHKKSRGTHAVSSSSVWHNSLLAQSRRYVRCGFFCGESAQWQRGE